MERRALRSLLAALWLSALAASADRPPGAARAQGQAKSNATCIFDHMALRSSSHACRPRAKAYPSGVTGRVRKAIYDASLTFGMPYTVLLQIASCESGLNPRATNGNHYGLFQFVPDTFKRAARQLRATTGIAARSYWNPLDSAYVAGFMFVTGQSRRWACEQMPVG